VNLAALFPGVGEAMGMGDRVLGALSGAARLAAPDSDIAKAIPGSIGEAAGSGAVLLTNAIFGKDDSNWIASGDTPTGTRRGEIGAGISNMVPIFGPEIAVLNEAAGNPVGNLAGDAFDTPNGAPTSGAAGNMAQKLGQSAHSGVADLFDGMFD